MARTRKETSAPSRGGMKLKSNSGAEGLLRVGSLPERPRFDLQCCKIERAPAELRSPYIMTVEWLENYGVKENRIALNVTNLNFIIDKLGDDSALAIGRKMRFIITEYPAYDRRSAPTRGLKLVAISKNAFPLPEKYKDLDGIPTIDEPEYADMPDWAK